MSILATYLKQTKMNLSKLETDCNLLNNEEFIIEVIKNIDDSE
jgi:hypothetical protein